MDVSRRDFFGLAAAAGSLAALGGLAGCSSSDQTDSASTTEETSYDISETKEADVVVVGGGMSGLAAAVSASETGANVVLLESNNVLGGNGQGTEGIFACGSSLQKELGIEFDFADVITEELKFFNYRIDTLAWKDMVESSASNLDWLLDNGVLIDGVDNYRGMGSFDGFHWWGGGEDDGYVTTGGAQNGYISPMSAKAEELGVDILMQTRGVDLIMDGEKVAGIVAQCEDESYVQINCKAVILATGGFADNDDMLRETGVDPETVSRMGMPGHNGDGFKMAMKAGGVDTRSQHCVMREPGCVGYTFGSTLGATGLHNGGPILFVNGDGERFTNENCITQNQAYIANCVHSQPECFAVINQAILDELNESTMAGIVDDTADAQAQGAAVYTADTIEDLASQIGADAEKLSATLDRYNTFCDQGKDEDFSKEPEMLKAMKEGPFYAYQMGLFYFTTLGGIDTNRNFEVVDADSNAIPGLYAVGADGCELYRETYTVMVPASCMGNNINSGRHAGENAAAYCQQ